MSTQSTSGSSNQSQSKPYVFSKCEQRVFGCYVRRCVEEDMVATKVSQLNTNTGTLFYNRDPRFYQNIDNNKDRHVYVFIDSFFCIASVHLNVCPDPTVPYKMAHYLPFHSGVHLFSEKKSTLHIISLLKSITGTTVSGLSAPIHQIYPVILDLKNSKTKNWIQSLALGLHFSAYWDRYDLSGGQKDGDIYKGLTIDQTHYQSKPIQPNKDGHRMFHRNQRFQMSNANDYPNPFSIPALEKTCVSEWKEEFLKDPVYIDLPPFPQIDGKVPDVVTDSKSGYYQRIAFYVCAGAKLLVMDQYQMPTQNKAVEFGHNRSLILPGGLVVIDATKVNFNVGVNIKNQGDGKVGANGKISVFSPLFKTYKEILEWSDLPKDKISGIIGIKNPVFFLGAIQSAHNSVIWSLCVERYLVTEMTTNEEYVVSQVTKGQNIAHCLRSTELFIPDHGFIVAVEEWETGLDEIIARHQYEQLHRGVTRLGDENDRSYQKWTDDQNVGQDFSNFKIADNQGIRDKITKAYNRDTKIEFNFNDVFKSLNTNYTEPLRPQEYRFSTTTLTESGLATLIKANIPPPPPPAYPPCKLDNRIYYLPNKITQNNRLVNLSTIFDKYKVFGNQLTLETRLQLRLKEADLRNPIPEYLWTKMTDRMNVTDTQDWVIPQDDDKIKLGVDGHWYEKTLNTATNDYTVIGSTTTKYYEMVIPTPKPPQPPKPPLLTSSGQNRGGKGPKRGGNGSGGSGQYRGSGKNTKRGNSWRY